MNRRNFIKVSGLRGGTLLLSAYIPMACRQEVTSPMTWSPNFFIKITSENQVTFVCPQSEIGQGTSTGLTMIAADELGASPDAIHLEFAAGSAERYNRLQDTGGSNGIRLLWEPLRRAAATTREILKQAAARSWGIPIEACSTDQGFVYNSNNNEKISFGALLEVAATLPAPRQIKLKEERDFKYIGRPIIGRRNLGIATGKYPYSIDLKLEGMVYAAIARCPVWKGRVLRFDDSKTRKVPGVLDVFEIASTPVQEVDYRGGVRAGVVVIAENTWAAFKGKEALDIQWEFGPNQAKTDQDLVHELDEAKANNKNITFDYKGAERLRRQGAAIVEAKYYSPFQVNACMEPLNAVAYHMGHQVEIWAGTQAPQLTREHVADFTKLPLAAVTVHTLPAGGGFGRRYFCDFVEEAVTISEKLRLPVKLTWSREDTIRTNKYHPLRTEYWQAALDSNDQPLALSYHGIVSKPNGYLPYPYGIPTVFHQYLPYKDGNLLPRASWRSVFAHHWGLGLECFVDELAHRAKTDPLTFRLNLLEKAEVIAQKNEWTGDDLYPLKLRNTLKIIAEKANWGKVEAGIFQGVSAFCYNTSYCSQVADISVTPNGEVKIHKFTAVIDCGTVINPSQAKAQVEGSIVWGLSALLKPAITVRDGRVEQSNFHDYDLLRLHETPEIEVHLVRSSDHPSGTGEPAVPGVAPAVLNAIFAATGKRVRKLPIAPEDLAV